MNKEEYSKYIDNIKDMNKEELQDYILQYFETLKIHHNIEDKLQKTINKQKEVLDKIKEDLEKTKKYNTSYQDKYGNELINVDIDHINYLIELLEEIE